MSTVFRFAEISFALIFSDNITVMTEPMFITFMNHMFFDFHHLHQFHPVHNVHHAHELRSTWRLTSLHIEWKTLKTFAESQSNRMTFSAQSSIENWIGGQSSRFLLVAALRNFFFCEYKLFDANINNWNESRGENLEMEVFEWVVAFTLSKIWTNSETICSESNSTISIIIFTRKIQNSELTRISASRSTLQLEWGFWAIVT
jgi:hypothetical protein